MIKPSPGPYQAFERHGTYFNVTYLFNVLDERLVMASSAETCCLLSRFICCVWLILRSIFARSLQVPVWMLRKLVLLSIVATRLLNHRVVPSASYCYRVGFCQRFQRCMIEKQS